MTRTTMSERHFLQYWKLEQLEQSAGLPLDHASSKQYRSRSLSAGDVLWIVTLRHGRLRLLGRLQVGRVVDRRTAVRVLGRKNLWDAPYHALPVPGTEMAIAEIGLDAITPSLRFASSKDRLDVRKDGSVDGKQLQAMRALTPGTVSLLTRALPRKALSGTSEAQQVLEWDEQSFPEGAVSFRTHLKRERSPALIRNVKARAKRTHGRILCQVCGFDFEAVYGEVGRDFIECHHTIPVSELRQNHQTRLQDIALLCGNCHRMVHRRRPWLRMRELHQLLASRSHS